MIDSRRAFEVVGEGIGHGPQRDLALGGERLRGGAGAATAAADQGDLDLVAAAGVRRSGRRGRWSPTSARRRVRKTSSKMCGGKSWARDEFGPPWTGSS